jgi:hypothetical protein
LPTVTRILAKNITKNRTDDVTNGGIITADHSDKIWIEIWFTPPDTEIRYEYQTVGDLTGNGIRTPTTTDSTGYGAHLLTMWAEDVTINLWLTKAGNVLWSKMSAFRINLTSTPTGTVHFIAYPASGSYGSVQTTPAGPDYPVGTVVTILAVPDPGHVFDHWEGSTGGTTTQNPFVTSPLTVDGWMKAYFKPATVDPISAEKVIIDVLTQDERFNVYPTHGAPSTPNTGTDVEVHYRFRNTGARAEFCFRLQTISDEPGMPPGDIISTPWDLVEAGAEHVHVHYLIFGAYGANVKTWMYARPPGGGSEQVVIPEYDFKINTYAPDQPPGSKKRTRVYTWAKDVYLWGSAEDDIDVRWAGTLDSASLEFEIETFIVGSSFKCHLNDQTIIEGAQYDSAKFTKDIMSVIKNGLNHILVEVSYLSTAHWTVNVKITVMYTCTDEEESQLPPPPTLPPGEFPWNLLIIGGVVIAGLYAFGRGAGSRTEIITRYIRRKKKK